MKAKRQEPASVYVRLPPPPRARYEVTPEDNSEVVLRCTSDLELCVTRVSRTQVRVFTRRVGANRSKRAESNGSDGG